MGNGKLETGQWLYTGNSIFSPDNSVELRMQDDGKLAVYHTGECRWQNTPEQRDDVKGVIMQNDGNCVIYTHDETPIWHTDTAPDSGCILAIQDDGNLCVYNDRDIATWASASNK